MFCTDKERETCDVEKRGCVGCYYDSINKEEIRREFFEDWLVGATCDEKVEKLIQNDDRAKEIKRLEKELQQEKEKNKKLEEEKEAFMRGYSEAREDEAEIALDLAKAGKIIDMMAEDLARVPVADFMSETQKTVVQRINVLLDMRKGNVKEYYFKKARGEEDEKS